MILLKAYPVLSLYPKIYTKRKRKRKRKKSRAQLYRWSDFYCGAISGGTVSGDHCMQECPEINGEGKPWPTNHMQSVFKSSPVSNSNLFPITCPINVYN